MNTESTKAVVTINNFPQFCFKVLKASKLNYANIFPDMNSRNNDLNYRLYYSGLFRDRIDAIIFGYLLNKRNGNLFIDVGANYGSFGSEVNKICGSPVIYFEPNPSLYDHLRLVIKPPSVVERYALSNFIGHTTLHINPFHTGSATIVENILDNSNSHIEDVSVPVTTLDDYAANNNITNLIAGIKIDVEGNEENVIMGCLQIISSTKPILCLEISDEDSANRITQNILKEYDFFYIEVPGLDFDSNSFRRLSNLFLSLILNKAYIKKFTSWRGYCSGLIGIPKEYCEDFYVAINEIQQIDLK